MPRRHITAGERGLLRSVFEETLPYQGLEVDTNDGNWGGKDNSITPEEIPYFSTQIFCPDFSVATSASDRSTFIHEFMHVWQFYHGVHKVLGFLSQAIRHPGDYDKAYPYDLSDSNDILDFNFEQQAAIIEDFCARQRGHAGATQHWSLEGPAGRTVIHMPNRCAVQARRHSRGDKGRRRSGPM